MRSALAVTLSVFLTVGAAGCGTWRANAATPEARQAVMRVIDHYGGLGNLKNISTIRGYAVVTTYDPDGARRVRGQDITVRPRAGRLTATGQLPGGTWRAKVSLDGGAKVSARGGLRLSDRDAEQIADSLRLVLHRFRGPMNLLDGGEQADRVESVFVGGYPLRRVGVSGRDELVGAYYFEEATDELRMVTTGQDTHPRDGTVTIYENMRTIEGIVLPATLEVVNLGRDSFVGDRKILSVRFTGLRVR